MKQGVNDEVLNASEAISKFSVNFSAQRLTTGHFIQCSRALIDTVSVAMAGHKEEASVIALQYGRGQNGRLTATAWGQGVRLPLECAALYNGVAGHVLDFDDVTSPLRGHPSIALLPPLVALGEALEKTGEDLVAAFVVGFEVLCKLAKCMVGDHYAKGWHSTASIGTVAATVACARLLGLSEMQTRHAIGLAVAQTGGTRANFGTMAKSFQAGNTGASALRAVQLAEAGFTGAPDAIGGAFGFMDLYANGESLEYVLAGLGQDRLELDESGIEIKKYPLCYATHRAIDGVLDLRAEHRFGIEDVQRVSITANKRALVPLIYPQPCTGLQAKFSMHYAVIAALTDGYVKLASFEDEAVQRHDVQSRLHLVEAREEGSEPSPRWTNVKISLKDGRVLEKSVTTLRGAANCPLTDTEVIAKANDCFAFADQRDRADSFIDAAFSLRTVRLPQILSTLTH